MKQFILEKKPDRKGFIRFEGDDYRYLARVRRLATGEFFPALLPDGKSVVIQVVSVDNKTLTGVITQEKISASKNSLPPIYLFQALPKGDKMDLIVRQAAEGAISGIVPFVSEFSSAKPGKNSGQKFIRWQRIIKEARQQCGSVLATEIHQPKSFDELFFYWEQIKKEQPGVIGLLFHHLPGLTNESLHGYLDRHSEVIVLVIGPEGGFSSAEAEKFMAAGFKSFTIGDTILRTETAALYAAAAVRIILLEKDSWEMMQKKQK